MADYDFTLGEGDTEPQLTLQLMVPVPKTDPTFSQYPNGKPLDLTGATVILLMRLADEDGAPQVTQPVTIVGDPTLGWISVPWLGFPGRPYNCRFKGTKNNGGKISFLNDRLFTLYVSPDP